MREVHLAICPPKIESKQQADGEDDDVDLFGSDSDDDEAADKVREERLAAYAAKKAKSKFSKSAFINVKNPKILTVVRM